METKVSLKDSYYLIRIELITNRINLQRRVSVTLFKMKKRRKNKEKNSWEAHKNTAIKVEFWRNIFTNSAYATDYNDYGNHSG